MSFLPPQPTGSDSQARFAQWLWAFISRRLKFRNSDTVRFDITTEGIFAHAAPARGSSRSGMSHLGEWSAATSYKAQQIVTRGALGEFIAFQDPPTGTAPETGAPYWHAWVHPFPGVWG